MPEMLFLTYIGEIWIGYSSDHFIKQPERIQMLIFVHNFQSSKLRRWNFILCLILYKSYEMIPFKIGQKSYIELILWFLCQFSLWLVLIWIRHLDHFLNSTLLAFSEARPNSLQLNYLASGLIFQTHFKHFIKILSL